MSQFKNATQFKPTIPPQTKFRKSVATPSGTSTATATSTETTAGTCAETDDDDAEILAIAEQMKEELGN